MGPVQNLVSASDGRREMNTSKKASLDVLVSHSPDTTLNTTVYKKSTQKVPSIAPSIANKLAVIKTLILRTHNLLSSPSAIDEEERITQSIERNGYPRKLIENPRQPTYCNWTHVSYFNAILCIYIEI